MDNTTQALAKRHRLTLNASVAVLLAVLFAYVWISVANGRGTLRLAVHEQSKQLALALEDAIDVVRSHVFIGRTSVEHAFVRGGGANKSGQEVIRSESAALFVDPKANPDAGEFAAALASASKMLPATAATHRWNPIFQWTYFYDAKARWFMIYPYLSQEDLFSATKTGDISAALRRLFDADGSRPIETVGPNKNPSRDMRWTAPYDDIAGKGRMVSLLAPVYLADQYMGVVGTDVTLKTLSKVVKSHAPLIGRALVVDTAGTVLADSGGALEGAARRVAIADIFPGLTTLPAEGDKAWLRFPVRGTEWTVLVSLPDSVLNRVILRDLASAFLVGILLVAGLLVLVWLQHRRTADLIRASASLEETRESLVHADRLGSLGGLIAGVGREIETPLRQAAQAATDLKNGLEVFREQQKVGLRRSELEEFVSRIDQNGEQLARQIDEASDLLQRFRQLAVDQASEGSRRFKLRELADNVLAVLRPALKRGGCTAENAIAAELEATGDAGAIGQALHHLFNDALERSRPGQTFQLTAGWDLNRQGELIEITLTDNSTTAPDAASDSLGLARRLARQIPGGELAIESGPDGNRLILRLPMTS